MNLYALKEVANKFAGFHKIHYIARFDDNLFKLILDNQIFYINLEKSKSSIFCTDDEIIARKQYTAPFDFALQKYCLKAEIIDCNIDGNNRILRLYTRKKLEYKILDCVLQLEFTGKYTNAIIMDLESVVLESLRKITQNSREIKIGFPLSPLPQQEFTPKYIEIGDIYEYLYNNYKNYTAQHISLAKQTALDSLYRKKNKLESLLLALPNKQSLADKSRYYAKIGHLMKNDINSEFIGDTIQLKDYNGDLAEYQLDFDINGKKKSSLINELFIKSKKFQAKAQNISIQEENLRDNIAFLDSKIDFIHNATTLNDIKMINPKPSRKARKKQEKYESFFIANVKISIGKNKNENIEILKDARANDIWMHVRNIPSSHLIIHSSKNTIDEAILRKAGEILVGFLRTKSGNFFVDYTKRKFVKIKEGANVVYSNYATMMFKK